VARTGIFPRDAACVEAIPPRGQRRMRRRWSQIGLAGLLLLLALSDPGHTQDWPRLPDGRVVITVKGVRLALPTDEASLHEFKFGPSPDDYRAHITLYEVLQNPDRAERLFDEWESAIVKHVFDPKFGVEYSRSNTPKENRADPAYLKEKNYSFSIGPFASRLCARDLSGWRFIYKNINAPSGVPPFDQTAYMACAGNNVLASYTSLFSRDWTKQTLPIFQENITKLLNDILVDLDVRTFSHDLRNQ
jgi:hypothetical protein